MENVEAICDNVVLLNKASVVAQGTVMNVRNSLKDNTYSLTYRGDADATQFTGIDIKENVQKNGSTTLLFTYNDKPDIQLLNNPMIQISEYREVIPSMQEVFLTLTDSSHE
jgi:ABC-type uncharacterized transport system ATPase subunit